MSNSTTIEKATIHEAVKRFCATQEAAANLTNYIQSLIINERIDEHNLATNNYFTGTTVLNGIIELKSHDVNKYSSDRINLLRRISNGLR